MKISQYPQAILLVSKNDKRLAHDKIKFYVMQAKVIYIFVLHMSKSISISEYCLHGKQEMLPSGFSFLLPIGLGWPKKFV